MKKVFVFLSALFIFLSASSQNFNVNGIFTITNPTYSGTFTIAHTANNQVDLSFSAIGPFMRVAVGNQVDFLNQAVFSTFRGGYFSSSIGGNVNAFATGIGNVGLNQVSGRTFIGSNVVDDGFSQAIVKGDLKIDSLRGLGGNVGDVLTKNAAGYFVPQAPSGGTGANGVFTSVCAGVSNITGTPTGTIIYEVTGKTVTITFQGSCVPTANNTATSFTLTLPNLGTITSANAGALSASGNLGGYGYTSGKAVYNVSTSKVQIYYISGSNWSGTTGEVLFTLQLRLL